MTHLDLFSGIGGFAIAAQACGYTTVGFCEREPYAQQILKERFCAESERIYPNTNGGNGSAEPWKQQKELAAQHRGIRPRLHDDIFTLNGADYAGVDLLTGGFPCQPFSVAGKRLGKADDRAIWPEMLRVIREAKPTWIIGENVAGIVTMELDNILSDLEALGYAAWPLVIPACAVDARHRRDRVWIVAHSESNIRRQDGRGAPQGEGRSGQEAEGRRIQERLWKSKHDGLTAAGEDVADAEGFRGNGNFTATIQGEQPRQMHAESINAPSAFCEWRDEGEWFAESGMGRVAHGIPHRAHRLRGLGNAIVPQVAEEIIRAIASLR